MKYWLICAFLSTVTFAYGQTMLIYDLENGTLDSIVSFPIDTSASSSHTEYFEGYHSTNVAALSSSFPTTNIFPQTEYTKKRKVELDYSVSDFPVRAAVKVFRVSGGTKTGGCSGAMISRKHVLTAAHCHFASGTNDQLSSDSFAVCPAYDNGSDHPDFGCVDVSKIYVTKDWSLFGEDFALLELKEPIGDQTGWLGVGFEEDSTTQVNRLYYQFSYPAAYNPWADSTVYNGDTMYYNYGKINYLTNYHLGVGGATGIPGESGAALTHVENNEEYTVYGTLSLASYSHTRINNWIYHSLYSIISDDLIPDEPIYAPNGLVYPNPAHDVIHIAGFNSVSVLGVQNYLGQEIKNWRQQGKKVYLDQFASGIYFLFAETDKGVFSLRFVKQ